jgi:hypothetical protein
LALAAHTKIKKAGSDEFASGFFVSGTSLRRSLLERQ